MASLACVAQDTMTAPPNSTDAKPIPVLSGGVAFVPTWDSGNPTLVSIISPVLLVPIRSNLVFESRAAFEGDFQRRNGNSGDFTGPVQKSLDYMELDYLANRYVTVTAGRFLIPFNIFNERLYPNWIRNTQTDPLIFPIGTGSDNGLMLRGGIGVNKRISLNYAVYFSVLSSISRMEVGQAIDAVTGARRLGFCSFFLPFSFVEDFDFRLRPAVLSAGYCAAVHTLLRGPTSDAAAPPAFSLSSHSSRHAPPVSDPNAADH